MSKILTVFGATGNQGGSVVKAVLGDASLRSVFKIRAVTRDVTKPAALELAAKGAEVISADMASQESLAPAVKGAHTVFVVTNYWEGRSTDYELLQGKAVTDACKAAGVQHLIFSSLLNVSELTHGRFTHVAHFDGKAKIEKYIRESQVPATFVLPGVFMSGYLSMMGDSENGTHVLSLPVSGETARIPLLDAPSDLGKYVKAAIKNYPALVGQRIFASNEYLSPAQIVSQFSEASGRPAVFKQIPHDVFKSYMTPSVAQELLENMLLFDEEGYFGGADLAQNERLLDEKPTSWKEYVARNKDCL